MSATNNMKYTIVTTAGIHVQIAKETEIEGYTEGVMEIFFPDDEELKEWSDEQRDKWTAENNKRMEAICKFLNENNI